MLEDAAFWSPPSRTFVHKTQQPGAFRQAVTHFFWRDAAASPRPVRGVDQGQSQGERDAAVARQPRLLGTGKRGSRAPCFLRRIYLVRTHNREVLAWELQ